MSLSQKMRLRKSQSLLKLVAVPLLLFAIIFATSLPTADALNLTLNASEIFGDGDGAGDPDSGNVRTTQAFFPVTISCKNIFAERWTMTDAVDVTWALVRSW